MRRRGAPRPCPARGDARRDQQHFTMVSGCLGGAPGLVRRQKGREGPGQALVPSCVTRRARARPGFRQGLTGGGYDARGEGPPLPPLKAQDAAPPGVPSLGLWRVRRGAVRQPVLCTSGGPKTEASSPHSRDPVPSGSVPDQEGSGAIRSMSGAGSPSHLRTPCFRAMLAP